MTDLLPCPFCASTDLEVIDCRPNEKFDDPVVDEAIKNLRDITGDSKGSGQVNCINCGCEGPFHETEEMAVTAWNKRAYK